MNLRTCRPVQLGWGLLSSKDKWKMQMWIKVTFWIIEFCRSKLYTPQLYVNHVWKKIADCCDIPLPPRRLAKPNSLMRDRFEWFLRMHDRAVKEHEVRCNFVPVPMCLGYHRPFLTRTYSGSSFFPSAILPKSQPRTLLPILHAPPPPRPHEVPQLFMTRPVLDWFFSLFLFTAW